MLGQIPYDVAIVVRIHELAKITTVDTSSSWRCCHSVPLTFDARASAAALKLRQLRGAIGLQRLVIRLPVVFDIRGRFRRRARTEVHRLETVLLVKAACGTVLLMCVKFQSIRGKTLGEDDQPRSPTLAPSAGIDKHPVDIRTLHRQISDNLLFKRTHPDIALSPDDFPKDRASAVEGEGLPQRKKRVCGLPRPVPNADDGRFVVVLK